MFFSVQEAPKKVPESTVPKLNAKQRANHKRNFKRISNLPFAVEFADNKLADSLREFPKPSGRKQSITLTRRITCDERVSHEARTCLCQIRSVATCERDRRAGVYLITPLRHVNSRLLGYRTDLVLCTCGSSLTQPCLAMSV
ncbi:hypothetical protein J6590_011107 [Homalodisca vitripennis]|nr:hypothetical protein J6590_011107 [Homalodisca vitripennis]